MAHPNEDLVRRGYAAFGTGDVATLGELFADDLVWHVVALVKVTGEREGKTLNDSGAQVFHVQGGKVTESWFHPGDAYAGDEFWS